MPIRPTASSSALTESGVTLELPSQVPPSDVVAKTHEPESGKSVAWISSQNLLRLGGLSALLAGICYVLVGLFHRANIPSSVTTTRWETVHVLACAMSFFGVLGLTGLYVRQAVKSGWLGLAGYILFSLWLVLIMGFSFVEAFILPHVTSTAPTLVQAWMGMFNGPAGKFDLGFLPTLWTLTAPVYILGGLLFGIATFRAERPCCSQPGWYWPPLPPSSLTHLSRKWQCRLG